jgi:hypothetical protein
MVSWELLSRDKAAESWDKNLLRFDDFTHTQTYSWGEYRSAFGWQPYRWVARGADGEIAAMMQGLVRIYPGHIGLVWTPGGPVGDIQCWNAELRRAIVESTGLRRLYVRICPTRHYHAEDVLALRSLGWQRSAAPLLSGLSMTYNPAQGEELRIASCTRNWRHNLRRSDKYGLTYHRWKNPDIETMFGIYQSMQDYKSLAQQFARKELAEMFDRLGDHIVLYRCDDEKGEPVSLRGCIIYGDKAWDLFAATSVQGRKIYASYGLFWQLMRHCQEIGVRHYDMGGIDPLHNPGVYDFKKGSGAIPLEYLGEWDWATSAWLGAGANWMISRREGAL